MTDNAASREVLRRIAHGEVDGDHHNAHSLYMAARKLALAALADEAASQPREEWRCFHCGYVFTDERCARLHFGRNEDSKTACVIKAGAEQGLLGALREAEYAAADARHAIADESTDPAKAYYAQMTRHNQALRNAEEAGYERGLADARLYDTAPPCDSDEHRNGEDANAAEGEACQRGPKASPND